MESRVGGKLWRPQTDAVLAIHLNRHLVDAFPVIPSGFRFHHNRGRYCIPPDVVHFCMLTGIGRDYRSNPFLIFSTIFFSALL